MVIVFCGDNSFEIDRALKQQLAQFDGEIERIDGEILIPEQLPSLFAGQTLFSSKRVVIIKQLAENKTIWPKLDEWLERVSQDTTIVLVESKLDKRTSTYKWLQKHTDLKEFALWTSKDRGVAEEWVRSEAKRKGMTLTHTLARRLLERTGLDQWRITHALDKLQLSEAVDESTITQVVDLHPADNVFELLTTALDGDKHALGRQLATLRQTEDPYRVFSLLASQLLQLATLAVSDKTPNEIAKKTGTHPFVLSKLAPRASKLGTARAKKMIKQAAKTDVQMKSTSTDPWVLVEKLLLEIGGEVIS